MKDLRERLAAAGVHTVLVQFTDLHGVAKGKLVPLAHLDDVLTVGASFDGTSIAGSGLPRTGARSQYLARGAASTAQPLPWLPGVARIVADGHVDGEPYDACPRQVLKRAIARLAEQRLSLQVGIQPEFFLLSERDGRWQQADEADCLAEPSHDVKSLARQLPFLRDLHEALERCGLDVLQLERGQARGQYAVDLAHADALASADHLMLFKMAAHAIAERHDMLFSMMPRPFADHAGSGMHCHVSLWEGLRDNARNVFVAHSADGSVDQTRMLSPLGGHFVAGVLAHAEALCALAAPTVNSYKRDASTACVQSRWATGHIAHGANNRTALVRTLHGRFEWRAPDASANPYLMLAGLIDAGLDGMERELAPGSDCGEDLHEADAAVLAERGIRALPQTLAEALDALEADATICAALGNTLAREFIAAKRDEAAEHARHVSDWELRRYACAF